MPIVHALVHHLFPYGRLNVLDLTYYFFNFKNYMIDEFIFLMNMIYEIVRAVNIFFSFQNLEHSLVFFFFFFRMEHSLVCKGT